MPADGDRQVEAGIRLRSLCEKIVSENRRGDVSFLSELREYTAASPNLIKFPLSSAAN